MLWRHVKVIVGVVTAGESIEAPPVLAQELAVLILVWELFCPKEQHVLTEVREPGQVDGVGHVPDVDVESSSRLVSRLIRNQ